MNTSVTPETREVLNALHYRPAVSIILPFEAKINLTTELTHSLKIAADKVEQQLLANYPADVCALVMKKLKHVIANLDFDSHKKSIVIYVSLLFEKVIYLDIAVQEKIIIDDSFEIRDLLYNNKQLKQFLVLLLSGKECRMFLGDSITLAPVDLHIPQVAYAYLNDPPERVSNFSDMQEWKQTVTNKFLYHIDTALDEVLNTYRLPLFILGAEKTTGHFKKFTSHALSIMAYVHGNYDDATLPQIEEILKPHIAAWNEIKQQELLNKLETAAGEKKLAVGIKNVWREATNHRGRLLVVEKNYSYAAQHGATDEIIEAIAEPYNEFSFIRDAVDDVIEKTLSNGGDVEFVNDGTLDAYDHIALIQYY